ncbi:hypothetical protein [Gimesia panareensis]|uniref:Uncharacterized protein n=1 Tax=Gimesia panareensis TaxID=2527978 RepID=A0A518FZ96_9PLAN|nr:hypothetical protein [Gimesia panareensis]QDT30736.1 hypothetical protein Enr10x_61040 [Gimesia panareensis]QDU53785.1 hypothetical protein Pan110_61790 [Gimesia panareensis]QDV21685.1 hypothetical protein Pan153_63750 [Gimesia panareensis]
MNHSTPKTDSDHSPEQTLSRQQIIGLALFAFSQAAVFVIYVPYTALTIGYLGNAGVAPPEIRSLSGPGVMGLWGVTGASAWLLLLIGKAYSTQSKATIENLANWSILIIVLSTLSFLSSLYAAIRYDISMVLMAGIILVIGLYQALILWLLT